MLRRGNGPSPVPSPAAPSFRSASGIRGEQGKEIESPTSSAQMFIPTQKRSRSGASDASSPAAAVKELDQPCCQTLRVWVDDEVEQPARDNATPATPSTSKGTSKDEERGIGGLGRQNTIMQRSVGTVLPTPRSTPPAKLTCALRPVLLRPPLHLQLMFRHLLSCPCCSASTPDPRNDSSTSARAFVPPLTILARTLVPPRLTLRPSSDRCLLLLSRPVRSWHQCWQ